MKTIHIKTGLFGKDDVFKILGVAHATGYPVLLVGPPGTGKTRALLDYSKALMHDPALNAKENWMIANKSSFILETDEGTRSTEVKGRINVKKLLLNHDYEITAPIVNAKFVLINEVDKASPGLRNSLLGVMNEKVLFNGIEKVKCHWQLFAGSCNILKIEEDQKPFWDRFVFKQDISRISKNQLLKYFRQKKKEKTLNLDIPTPAEVEQIAEQIPSDKLQKFLDVAYEKMSDRTVTFLPRIIAAVSVIYKLALGRAMIQTMKLMLGDKESKQLSKLIEPAELATIRSKIEIVMTLQDYDQIKDMIKDVEQECIASAKKGVLTKSDVEELTNELNQALNSNPAYTNHDMEAMSDMYADDVEDQGPVTASDPVVVTADADLSAAVNQSVNYGSVDVNVNK
jgi:MoxR-like ATPase